jgi:polysaccharide export outer membrane protein
VVGGPLLMAADNCKKPAFGAQVSIPQRHCVSGVSRVPRHLRFKWLRGLLVTCLASGVGAAADANAAPPPPRTAVAPYVIGPGDVLQVFVWKEPDLTREVTVRADGKLTLPLLGDVEAAGRNPQDLSQDLSKALARFIEAPQVSVGVAQANSTKVYVIGQVGKPGDYALVGGMTVLKALALAGGFKDYAKTDSIVIVREEASSQTIVPVNYKKLEGGKDLDQNVTLHPGDTIIVP